MTDRELKKLRRADLLEILVAQSREIERLQQELEQAKQQAANRAIEIDHAGTLAEAALRLNEVFSGADAAAQQYLENIQTLSVRQEEICAAMEQETQQRCAEMEQQTKERCRLFTEGTKQECEAMIASAKSESQHYWVALRTQMERLSEKEGTVEAMLQVSDGEAE